MPPKGWERSLEEKILRYVSPEPNTGCWLWIGGRDTDDYGVIWHDRTTHRAHRVIYESVRGLIPDGLQLDHLCRTTCCVNPDHMEPVTCRENLLRGKTIAASLSSQTHCKRGHEFSSGNTRNYRGSRVCRECERKKVKDQRARRP